MSIDLTKIHDLEQKAMALMAFFVTHANQVQQAKNDIADLFKQITDLKGALSKKE